MVQIFIVPTLSLSDTAAVLLDSVDRLVRLWMTYVDIAGGDIQF